MPYTAFMHAKEINAPSTKSITSRILSELGTENLLPADSDSALKQNMFLEIVGRCVADVAGHLQLLPQHQALEEPQAVFTKREGINIRKPQRVTIGDVMKGVKQELPNLSKTERLDFVLGVAQSYSKGIVQTPHPTEMLSQEAIEAEKRLMETLEEQGVTLFTQNKSVHTLSHAQRKAIGDALANLHGKLKPVEKPLSIRDEMGRSVVFSEKMFDAVPLITNRILKAAEIESGELTDAQLQKMFHLLVPATWSPGDRDSKPDMTVDELEKGLLLNRRAVMKHYAKELIDIAVHGHGQFTADHPKLQKALHVLERLMVTAQSNEESPNEQPGKMPLADYVSKTLKEIGAEKSGEALVDYIRSGRQAQRQEPLAYNNKDGLLRDLFALREEGSLSSYRYEQDSSLTNLDSLIIQAGNFGMSALRSQIRQNRDVHEKTFNKLAKLVATSTGSKAALNGQQMLEKMSTNKKFKSVVRSIVANHVMEMDEYDHCKTRASAEAADKLDDFYFYQTLKGMMIAAENPDFIPQYLIAECANAEDMYKVCAMMQAVIPQERKGMVEVVPLVEHPDQVLEKDGKIPYVEMMKEVLSNPHFRAYQDEVSQSQYNHLLQDTNCDSGKPESRALRVNDMMAQIDPLHNKRTHRKEDEKDITTAKLCMGAGSDVTKAGGISAASLMQNAMQRLREELLTLDRPVRLIEYLGCGGGVHRTQPVAPEVETVQGRSMRQTPDAIATKVTALLTRHIRNRLASHDMGARVNNPGVAAKFPDLNASMARMMTAENRRILAQLNLGNLANLPDNRAAWENYTKDVAEKATRNYMAFADSKNPEYTALLQHSADIFAKLTSFAARPTNRVSAKAAKETFPPAVQMDKLRAIGYGAALNTAGTCASLYYGVGSAIADAKEAAHIYTYEPKLQDMVNRATYGVIMADMDTAWRYLGEEKTPDAATIASLAEAQAPTDGTLQLAKRALAKITLEHQRTGEKLVELHSSITQQPKPDSSLPMHERLLSLLPSTLSAQLESSRRNIELPRRSLGELFRKFQTNNGNGAYSGEVDPTLPESEREAIAYVSDKQPQRVTNSSGADRPTEYYAKIIYPAMGAIMECFEHAPRAYTSPN